MVNFATGLESGFRVGQGLVDPIAQGFLAREEMKFKRQQEAQKQETAFRTELREDLKTLNDLVSNVAEKGGAEAVNRVISNPGFLRQVELLAGRAQSGGVNINPDDLMGRFQAAAAGAETAQDRQTRQVEEAQGEAAGAVAQLGILEQLPEEQQEAVRQKLGFATKQQAGEFLTLLDEAERLVAAGQAGTSRHQFVLDRLKRLSVETQGPQLSLQFDEEGRLTGLGFGEPTGAASKLTGAQALREDQRIAGIDQSVTLIDGILADLETDPEDFGLVGSLRGSVQSTVSAMSDMAELISNATGGVVDLNALGNMASETVGVNIFDENLPGIQVLENQLASSLAQLRLQRQGGNIRAFSSIFEKAHKDVQLTGLTSSGAVRERLQVIKGLFEQERKDILRGVRGESDELTPEELQELEDLRREQGALE